MTYCLAVTVQKGLVFVSDSRTNAGVDQISIYSKMHRFGRERERQLVLLSAGNLATSQSVVARLQRDLRDEAEPNLHSVSDLHEAADYVGSVSRGQQSKLTGGGSTFEASFILGGQIGTEPPAIMLVYPEGNHVTATSESKYGKPILDRIVATTTSLEHAALCALVSMDSTLRSNVTVGPPIELLVYHRDSLTPSDYLRLDNDSAYLRELKSSWEQGLREAFHRLPPIHWGHSGARPVEGRSASG